MKILPVAAFCTLIAWSPCGFAETDEAMVEIESDSFQTIFLDIGSVETLPDYQSVWSRYRYAEDQNWLEDVYNFMPVELAFDCDEEVFAPVRIEMTADDTRIVQEFDYAYPKREWRPFDTESFVDKGLSMICDPAVN